MKLSIAEFHPSNHRPKSLNINNFGQSGFGNGVMFRLPVKSTIKLNKSVQISVDLTLEERENLKILLSHRYSKSLSSYIDSAI